MAELRLAIPSRTHLSDLVREISDLAQQSQLFVTSVNPGVPLSVVPVAPAVTAPATPAEGEGAAEGEQSDEGDAGTEPTTPAPVTIDGFYAVPFEVVVLGAYPPTVDFINRLQTMSSRLLVVTGISSTAQEPTGAQSGRPAVVAGDIETSIKGYAYVLLDPTAAPLEEETTEPVPMPVPAAPDNPFAPAT